MKIEGEDIIKKRSMAGEVMSRLIRNKGAVIGGILLIFMVAVCLLAPVIAPYSYDAQDVTLKFMEPCREYIFATDELGRDIFSRILYGGRISLMVAVSATAISAFFGVILGAIAGFYGGRTDNIIMRCLDIFMAIPYLLLAIAVSTAAGSGLTSAIIAVGVAGIPNFARTVRGPILSVKEQEFIEAARAIDAKDARIMFKHLLPNVLSPFIVALTGGVANAINSVAALSFLGLGVPAPYPEWGAMISSARSYILQHSYMVTFPGHPISLVVIALNVFGDGLRDALDRRVKS
ncbi:MAG: ABC transporter permease [Lachnospiraceae bacterium]|nr:ABC transporter permease [Lachnospiraceae bacterium]